MVHNSSIGLRLFPVFGFCLCAILFWPGLLRPDSLVQMQQGISGTFTDFHPPMMGALWGVFHKFHSGSGTIFIWHLMLYWGAVTLFAKAEAHKAKWVYIISFLPPVFAYQLLVVKDISFVNAYLFCAAWIHFYSMREDLAPSIASLLLWILIAFYGTCSAYQALVALPWLCLWFAKFYSSDRSKSWIKIGLLIFGLLTVSVITFNKIMASSSNRFQHTRLYDLAGISMNLNMQVFPEYIKKNPAYSFKKIKQLYNTNRHDDLTFLKDGPLLITENSEELEQLNKCWAQAIFSNPIAYLKHRAGLFKTQMTISLLKYPEDIKGESSPFVTAVLKLLQNLGIFSVLQFFMAYGLYFVWQIFYVVKGYKNFGTEVKYTNLFFQNIMGLSLVLSLFFIAGAAEARYAYLAIAMLFFSHPFLLKSNPTGRFIRRRFS